MRGNSFDCGRGPRGAFSFGKEAGFPVSALGLGADVVIQSLHKTPPSLTQTAVMHVKAGFADLDRIDRYAHMFQSKESVVCADGFH